MMEIVEKRLSELKHPAQNVRMHSQKQIKEYCRSISKYGQTKPMVIDEDGVILIGNGLYDALLAMGRESGSCMVKAGLTGYEPDGETVLLAGDSVTLQALGEGNYTVLRDYGDLFWDVRMNINDLTNNFTEYFILPAAPTYGVGRNP